MPYQKVLWLLLKGLGTLGAARLHLEHSVPEASSGAVSEHSTLQEQAAPSACTHGHKHANTLARPPPPPLPLRILSPCYLRVTKRAFNLKKHGSKSPPIFCVRAELLKEGCINWQWPEITVRAAAALNGGGQTRHEFTGSTAGLVCFGHPWSPRVDTETTWESKGQRHATCSRGSQGLGSASPQTQKPFAADRSL